LIPKQYLLGFLILENQLANIPDRGFLFLRNTLLLHIPLLALTEGQNYGGTNTLAVCGLEELRVVDRNFIHELYNTSLKFNIRGKIL
jgi:hypothetical protein